MAILSAAELQQIRNFVASEPGIAVNYTKPILNAAAQAVEDLLTNNSGAISNAIDAATTPTVLTAAQKKAVVAATCLAKYLRDK